MTIHAGEPGYDDLFKAWLANRKPGEFDHHGARWIYMTDNEDVFFVRKGSKPNFDEMYGQNSFH